MVDVYIVTLCLLGILITLPALMVGINLMLPGVTQRIETRLAETPGKSFVMGIMILAALLLFIAIVSQVNFGPFRLVAFVSAVIGTGIGTVGAAGMARVFSTRLAPHSRSASALTNLIRGPSSMNWTAFFPLLAGSCFFPRLAPWSWERRFSAYWDGCRSRGLSLAANPRLRPRLSTLRRTKGQ